MHLVMLCCEGLGPIREEQMHAICQMRRLTRLTLCGATHWPPGVHGPAVIPADISQLTKLFQLHIACTVDNVYCPVSLPTIVLQSLAEVSISCAPHDGFLITSKLSGLTQMVMDGPPAFMQLPVTLTGLQRLQVLELHECNLEGSLNALAELPDLLSLTLDSVTFSAGPHGNVALLSNLTRLT